jgi:hypothetical protein
MLLHSQQRGKTAYQECQHQLGETVGSSLFTGSTGSWSLGQSYVVSRGGFGFCLYCVPQYNPTGRGRSSYSEQVYSGSYLRQAVTLQAGTMTGRSSKSYNQSRACEERFFTGKLWANGLHVTLQYCKQPYRTVAR